MEALSPEVLEDLRHGRATRERKIAVCTGGAHLAPAERAEILAVLAGDAVEIVANRAQDAILSQPVESFVEALKREQALPTLFSYAARNLADKPGVCDAMVQNKNCPAEHLVPLVRYLSTLGIQALMEELERVSESPALASALEHSTSLTADQRNQLHELHGPGNPVDEAALSEAAAAVEPDVARRQTLIQRLAFATTTKLSSVRSSNLPASPTRKWKPSLRCPVSPMRFFASSPATAISARTTLSSATSSTIPRRLLT
ncbi:MAG: hypothetical protein DMG49_16045 [Acidobacteria bacterium]|nr:MAG: hypothetical protein DMG49_16045 [Acidobacteriota bacterium]